MDIADYILIAGFLAAFGELFVLIWFSSQEKEKWQWYSEILAGVTTLLVAVAFVLLLKYFLSDNFTFTYVIEHSQSDAPTLIKISGVWSGQEGSLLLWAVLVSFLAFIYKSGSKPDEQLGVVQRTYAILAGMNLLFILLVLLDSPFETQRAVLEGIGLNPLLRTNWNVIHPFIVFVGYAASTVPFAIGLSRLFSREPLERNQKSHLDFHMAIAWLFLSLGIIIGGYWAYITLGWGGYWAWDPVETASLIPWILCTAYFHTRPLFKSDSRSPSVIAVISFITVIYATYITRGGALQSVHAFPESPVTQMLVILIIGSFIAMLVPFVRRFPSFTGSFTGFQKMSLYNKSMVVTFSCLIILAFLCFLGIFLPLLLLIVTGVQYSVEPTFYTYSCAPFALLMIFSLITCQMTRYSKGYDLNRLLRLFLIPIVVIGVLFVFLQFPTRNPIANFGGPVLALGSGIALFRMLHNSFTIEHFPRALRESSRAAIHAGLAIILLGAFISSTTQIQENAGQTFEVTLQQMTPLEDTGLSLRIFDASYTRFVSDVDFEMQVTVGILEGGNVVLKAARLLADPDYRTSDGQPRLHAFPAIFHGLLRDIYVSVVGISEGRVLLRVTVMSLVSFVWIGSALLCIGIIPLMAYQVMDLVGKSKPKADPDLET